MQQLNVYIDETGEFGFDIGSSKLYGVSFVFHENKNDITKQISRLNNKLKQIGYTKMIHTADLINNRGDYVIFSLKQRKQIFNALYQFARIIPVKYYSIIIDKKYTNTMRVLKRQLRLQISSMIKNYYNYFTKFDKIVLYYDDGQEDLSVILKNEFEQIGNMEHYSNFDHGKERLFQVADMLTYLDKRNYKYQNKRSLTKSEKHFFEEQKMRTYLKELKNKQL